MPNLPGATAPKIRSAYDRVTPSFSAIAQDCEKHKPHLGSYRQQGVQEGVDPYEIGGESEGCRDRMGLFFDMALLVAAVSGVIAALLMIGGAL